MLANLKKRVQEGVCEVPPTMEVTQSSASLEDTGQSPLEVPEESIHGEQPLGNPRTDIGRILLRLQAGQESLLSEVAQLRTSVDQTNEQLQVAESRLSSLEHKACASQLTNSIMLALQSDPQAVPAASASSFSSQQMTLDAAQTAPPTSPSVYSGDTSSEPPLSSSEQFRNTSSTQGYSEIVEKAHQMHADAWSQEMNFKSETAHLEAEESDNQEDTSSRTSPLITPECETEPLTSTSTEETALPVITSVRSLERTSESGDAPIEPGPLSSSEQFRTTSSTRVYCETEEKAHQTLPDDWLKETISESETARIKAEESDQPEVTSSEALSLNAPECETEPLTLTSTEEDPLPVITSVWSLERTSESETALARAEDSDQQEDTSSRALLSIAPEYEANPQPLKSTEEAALPVMAAVGSQETIAESKTARRELEECDQQENNFSGRSAQAYMPEPQPLTSTLLETPQATPPAAMEKKAPGRDTQMSKRRSTNKRSSSTALNSTTTSAGTLRCLPSSAPADGGPPTKRCRQTSIAWIYFTKQPKNIATCRVCEEDVQTGKIGACGNVGTAPLLRHLEHKHKIPSIVWQHFKMWSKFSATCRFCKEIVDIGKIDCSRVGTASLLSHLTRKHGMPQEKVATSGMPQEKVATSVVTGAGSEMQDAERPSTTEGPSRTTSAASPSTTPSPGTLSHLPSSSPTEVRPPTKRRRTSIAWKYFTKWSKFKATCTICKEDVKFGKRVGCGNVDTAALHSHLRRKHGITREKVATSVVTGAGSEMQDAERPSTTEGPSRTTSAASPSTTPSPVKLSPTKRCRQTSIAWLYFTGRSKFIATCRVCEEDVQTGKIEACGNVGTAALLRHLEHKHKIPAIVWQHFKMWSKFSATCRFCKEIVDIGKIDCSRVGTASLLSHLTRKHGMPQEKVATSGMPGALSKTQDVERPCPTESPSRTTSAASTSTTNSPVMHSCLPSSSPKDVGPPTKRRGTPLPRQNLTKQSKFSAVCQERMRHPQKGEKSNLQLNRGAGGTSPAHSNGAESMEEGDRYFHNMATPITLPEGTKPDEPVTATLLQTTLQTTIQFMNKTLADSLAAVMKPLEEIKTTMIQASQKPESEFIIALQEENREIQRDIQLLKAKVIQFERSAKESN